MSRLWWAFGHLWNYLYLLLMALSLAQSDAELGERLGPRRARLMAQTIPPKNVTGNDGQR